MAAFVVSGRNRESDHIRWILLNTAVFSAKSYLVSSDLYFKVTLIVMEQQLE